ncbi:unnamed protein product [Sphagnum balticum]
MIVKNIKKYGSEQAGSDIKDAVFTVPAHWGFRARLALVNAAYLADLSILGLVNENSAAAIHFAITRNDSDPINVGFFNLGSQNLQVSIVLIRLGSSNSTALWMRRTRASKPSEL